MRQPSSAAVGGIKTHNIHVKAFDKISELNKHIHLLIQYNFSSFFKAECYRNDMIQYHSGIIL